MDRSELSSKLLAELRALGRELNIRRVDSYKKDELIDKIIEVREFISSSPLVENKPRLGILKPHNAGETDTPAEHCNAEHRIGREHAAIGRNALL